MNDFCDNDFWKEYAIRLQDELTAAAVAVTAPNEVIARNAGPWFADLAENTQLALIAVMRNSVNTASTI